MVTSKVPRTLICDAANTSKASLSDPQWLFEPKWDGYRANSFRNEEMLEFQRRCRAFGWNPFTWGRLARSFAKL
jgi:ATP-dependent DNA ligase